MALRELEINRFGEDGDVIRSIRCLAGRVTVFRSQNPEELERFKGAIEGKAQTDRFSVLLDGNSFNRSAHIFIGYGSLDEMAPAVSVTAYLEQRDVESDAVERTLLDFGLGGLSTRLCMSLAPHEWKMLRLLAILVRNTVDKVAILHEPFESIPEKYREVYAKRLSQACWEKQAIVVVTKLSFRPQSWIENDYIARVQLERPRQGTIGFGGGEAAMSELLSQVRKDASQSASSVTKHDLTSAPAKQNFDLVRMLERPRTVALAFAVFISLFGYGYFLIQSSKLPQAEMASRSSSGEAQVATADGSNQELLSSEAPPAGSETGSGSARPSVALVGDGYPPEIREAWYLAIERPDSLLRSSNSKKTTALAEGNGGSPIRALYEELSRD